MSQRKNQNSILFLTTLGVYLGLLIVGSPSRVLGQNESKHPVIFQREAKFACPNDGLINGERAEDINPFDYDLAKRIKELFDNTQVRFEFVKLTEPETLPSYPFFFEQVDFGPYINRKGKIINHGWKTDSSEWASAAHAGQIADLSSLFLTPLADCVKPSEKKFPLVSSRLEISEVDLKLDLRVAKATKARAHFLAEALRQSFEKKRSDVENQAINSIYESTQVRSENNQVFIITRLPRAALDPLLAKDAK